MRVQNLYLVLLTVSLISVPGVVCGQDRDEPKAIAVNADSLTYEGYLKRIDDNENGILEVRRNVGPNQRLDSAIMVWIRVAPLRSSSVMKKVNAKKAVDAKIRKKEADWMPADWFPVLGLRARVNPSSVRFPTSPGLHPSLPDHWKKSMARVSCSKLIARWIVMTRTKVAP